MKILIKLILVLSLIFGTLYSQNINECKTDIYFGNGVWNSQDDAEKSIIQLQYIIDTEVIKNDQGLKAKYGKIKLQYNTNYGGMIDVLETFYQLKEAGQIGEALFFTFVDELMAKQVSAIVNEDVKTLREQIINLIVSTEATEVDDMITKYYEESFKLSHKVLLISHSQGNLFANRVYDSINTTGYKNYFANLQVASPASQVNASKGDYVTLSTDSTSFDPVINFIPGSMSPNASGDSGHKLVNAYLSQADPLSKITTKIKQLLSDLDTEPSQWELESEQNKGTNEYRITVKHRFDTSIGNIANVYPFTPSKKLYYVESAVSGGISGYVKARCGGYKIETTWVGQNTATEVAKLLHTAITLPDEILLANCQYGWYIDPNTLNCTQLPVLDTKSRIVDEGTNIVETHRTQARYPNPFPEILMVQYLNQFGTAGQWVEWKRVANEPYTNEDEETLKAECYQAVGFQYLTNFDNGLAGTKVLLRELPIVYGHVTVYYRQYREYSEISAPYFSGYMTNGYSHSVTMSSQTYYIYEL